MHAPVKIPTHVDINIYAEVFKTLKMNESVFKTVTEGNFIGVKNYSNRLAFKGLCVRAIKEIKDYCIRNRIKK